MDSNNRKRNLASLRRWFISAGLSGVCLLTPAFAFGDHLPPQTVLRIGAAEHNSGIYAQAQNLSLIFARESTKNRLSPAHEHSLGVPLSSAGSLSNIRDLTDGRAEFAIANSDFANAIYLDPEAWDLDQAVQRVKLVATLQPYVLQIIVRKGDDKPPTLDMLRHASVSIGLPDAMANFTLKDLFSAHGIPFSGMTVYHYPMQQSVRKLREGQIDAFILLDCPTNAIIAELLEEDQFTLLSLNAETLSRYLQNDNSHGLKLSTATSLRKSPENYVSVEVGSYLLVQDTVSPTSVLPVISYLQERNTMQQDPEYSGSTTRYQFLGIDSPIPLHDALNTMVSNQPDQDLNSIAETPPPVFGNLDEP